MGYGGSLERVRLIAQSHKGFDDGDDGEALMNELLIAAFINLGVLSRHSIKPSTITKHPASCSSLS